MIKKEKYSNYTNSKNESITKQQNNISLTNFIQESDTIFSELKTEIDYLSKIYNDSQLNKFNEIIQRLKNLFKNYSNNFNILSLQIYEPYLRKYESELRHLNKIILMYQLQKDTMENKLKILQKKNEEYQKLKKITNVIVENGEFIFTDRKENEIIILRAENSILKKELYKYEEKEKKLITEFELSKKIMQNKINELTYKIDSLDPLNSNSSININLNDISHSNLFLNQNTSLDNSKKKNKSNFIYNNIKNTKINTSTNIFSEIKNHIKNISTSQNNYTTKKNKNNKNQSNHKNNHQRNNRKLLNQEFSYPGILLNENILKNPYTTPMKKVIETFTPVNKKEKRNIFKTLKSNIKNNFTSSHKNNKNKINLSQRDVNTLFMNSKISVNNFLIYRNASNNNNNNNSRNSIYNNDQTINNGFFTIKSSSGRYNSSKDITNKSNNSYKSLNYLFKK